MGVRFCLVFVIRGIRNRFAFLEEPTCLLWQTNSTGSGFENEIGVILTSNACREQES